jgi:hypothetical protein
MTPGLNAAEAADGLTTMVLAIRDDPKLSAWFETLQRLTPARRQVEILRMTSKPHPFSITPRLRCSLGTKLDIVNHVREGAANKEP